jgi:hypothetical protein
MTLDVKWRELEVSLLPSSALKCVPRIAKNRITVAQIATDRSMNMRADCHRLDLSAELGNPQPT